MIRVMLIDDHAIVRLGMRSLLETRDDVRVVAEAGSRLETLELIQEKRDSADCPDLAVVDLVLGTDDGLEFVKELKHLCPDISILVVTMQDEAVYAERVLKAGAKGFLQKRDATRHLLEAVDTVSRGDIYVSRASRARGLDKRLDTENCGENGGRVALLSDRELHVFQMIGTGLANKEIADHLSLSTKTIETYKENIKRKLGVKTAKAVKALATIWVETGSLP